ncbi:MAG: heme ABC exporter ATP-binding protein CcmA [Gammaproteobacteria bacterium]|nr:heme ABC exporter ATP-binding protein CcmA [Gammaproteobacteria bacterium]
MTAGTHEAAGADDGRWLRVRDLEIWRGEHCLFEGLDFELAPGQLALLVGPNGAGKTTLLRTVAGLTPPSSGEVSWTSRPVRSLEPEKRTDIAYRGHLDGLKRELTVRENVEFHAALSGITVDTDALLAELGIAHRRDVRVRHLSAGQRRRTALATLRVGGAKLWILDEPMTHLDAAGHTLVAGWIREHVAQGGLAIVATHRPDELASRGTLMIEL